MLFKDTNCFFFITGEYDQVTPPEHAAHYSESLVLLPRTYQANLYEGLGPETGEAVHLAGSKDYERAELR